MRIQLDTTCRMKGKLVGKNRMCRVKRIVSEPNTIAETDAFTIFDQSINERS